AAAIVDLPVVENCHKEFSGDNDDEDDGITCRSNYCLTHRDANTEQRGDSINAAHNFLCQTGPLLARFDILVDNSEMMLPGTCIKYQPSDLSINEDCACPYRDNCTTSSLYPANSGLPKDTRTAGMITCAVTSLLGKVRKCKGHACFIKKKRQPSSVVGCIT
ncbi:hypothetical protein PFISCL1PPCAC_12948, partial [Pristionchus fissidentatus]